jgi:hypothetical protein
VKIGKKIVPKVSDSGAEAKTCFATDLPRIHTD